jgi:hypothetical protein
MLFDETARDQVATVAVAFTALSLLGLFVTRRHARKVAQNGDGPEDAAADAPSAQ